MEGDILGAQQHRVHPIEGQNGVQAQGDGQVEAALHRPGGRYRAAVLAAVPGVDDHGGAQELGRTGQRGDGLPSSPAEPDGQSRQQQSCGQDKGAYPLPGTVLSGLHMHIPPPGNLCRKKRRYAQAGWTADAVRLPRMRLMVSR